MAWLAAFIIVILSGAPQVHASGANAARKSHFGTSLNILRQLQGTTHIPFCQALKAGQSAKGVVTPAYPACFSVELKAGEAEQITVSQPLDEDLEIHVTSKTLERLVDGFDMGVETITLSAAGPYRVEVRTVKPAAGALTISASLKPLPLAKAAAWAEAERLATLSKRSRTIESINRSMALWGELDDKISVARTYLKRESKLRYENPAVARANAEEALERCLALHDARCIAEAENNSGYDALALGDVDNATRRLKEAAMDWRRLGDPLNAARTQSNLGRLFWQIGDFEQAIRFDERAKAVQRGKDAAGYATDLNDLGLCYLSLAEYEKAQKYFEAAITGFSESPKFLIRARLNLARAYMLQNRIARAQSLLEDVLIEAKQLSNPDPLAIGDILRNLGQALLKRVEPEQARSRFEEALAIDQSDGDRRGQSSALHYLGLLAQQRGDISTARNFLREAVQLRRESGLRDDASESLSALAGLEYAEGRMDAARDYAEQALKLLESVRSQVPSPDLRASFYSRKRRFFDLLVDMAMAPGTPSSTEEGLLAAERGRARALMDLLAGGSLVQLHSELIQRRDRIQRRIEYLTAPQSKVPAEEVRRQIEPLVASNDEVEAQIRQTIADQKLAPPLTSIQEIQRHLATDSAMLEFHLGERQSYLWLIDAHQVRSFTLASSSTIESEASPLIKAFGRISERRYSPAKQVVFERAINKLSTTLLGGISNIQLPQRLILVPDGVLHRIPFAALRLPAASTPLGLAHDLVQVPSAAYLMVGKQPQPVLQFPQTIMAMVDPVFSGSDPRVPRNIYKSRVLDPESELGRLPFTGEVSIIKSLVPGSRRKIFRGFDSSRKMLRRLPLEDFAVLHFSTHALIDDRTPEHSHIALSGVDRGGRPVDGFLGPKQLSQLHLNGSIVVLSACNTALGKQVPGEGLAGLTSSLLFAGGSQLVLTLTEVDAEASSDYFSSVYRRFLNGSTTMEHAMTLARRAMVRSGHYSDPYFWASVIVVGSPSSNGADDGRGAGVSQFRR